MDDSFSVDKGYSDRLHTLVDSWGDWVALPERFPHLPQVYRLVSGSDGKQVLD